MARLNITVPDALAARAQKAGLNILQAAAGGIAEELDRREKVAALDDYLAEADAEQGPATAEELAEAAAWADTVLAPRSMTDAADAQRSP